MKGCRRLAILGFHKIGEPPAGGRSTEWRIRENIFVGYLKSLHENDWQVVDLTAVLRALATPDSLPERAALLTFDDGYRSMREVVLPRLLQFGFPAVLFVPTGFIGGHNDFDRGFEPEEAMCDWDDLQELDRSGISIQSHGVSHQRLSWLEPAGQEEEIVRSKAALEGGIGKAVEVFAYPYGDEGAEPQMVGDALRRAGYRAACLYGGGPNPLPIVDPYRLSRIPMSPDTDLLAALDQ